MTHRSSLRDEPGDWDWAAVRATCWREARRVLGASAAAEDVAQDAVLKAWRQRASCRSPEHPLAWVAAIARREALRAVAAPRCEPLERAPEPSSPGPDPAIDLILDVR